MANKTNNMDQVAGMVTDNMNTISNKEDATMMNQTMEMVARNFAQMNATEYSTEEVAGTIVDWAIGYRCEHEDVPTEILEWCKSIDTERADAINRVIVINKINEVDFVDATDSDDAIMDLGLALANKEWSMGAMEWLVRRWTHLEDADIEQLVGSIVDWQIGRRCEQEDQPTVVLYWALNTGISGFDSDLKVIIDCRIGAVVAEVRSLIDNGDDEDTAWNCVIVNGGWHELEIQMAKEEYQRQEEEFDINCRLREMAIENAREVAHDIWDSGDDDGIYKHLVHAIEECSDGRGTKGDWLLIIEMVTR